MLIDPLFFELLCTQTLSLRTDRQTEDVQTDRQTPE